MSTWKGGRTEQGNIKAAIALPLDTFLSSIERNPPVRVRGTAVFMTSTPEGVPVVLLHHLKHNKVLHETVVLLSVQTRGIPEVGADNHVTMEPMGQGFFRVVANYGFMQSPNIPEVLAEAAARGVAIPPMDTSYFLGRERLVLSNRAKMSPWRKALFAPIARHAPPAPEV